MKQLNPKQAALCFWATPVLLMLTLGVFAYSRASGSGFQLILVGLLGVVANAIVAGVYWLGASVKSVPKPVWLPPASAVFVLVISKAASNLVAQLYEPGIWEAVAQFVASLALAYGVGRNWQSPRRSVGDG